MNTKQIPKAPWINRFAIWMFTAVIAILILWLLGFLIKDIKSIEGPRYYEIEKKYIDQSLLDKKKELEKQITVISRDIVNQKEKQQIIRESSDNLQRTINQLTELQKQSIEKGIALTAVQQKSLTISLNRFLDSQKNYQDINSIISTLSEKKHNLAEEKEIVYRSLNQQRIPARNQFRKLNERHRLKLASYQLLVLLPLLLTGAFLLVKNRSSIYLPLFIAFALATGIKVITVIHEYFPTRYFKYILVTVLLLVIGKFLINIIRSVAFPKTKSLLKQYREAYERFLCPVCEYPIRTGPRKFLYWTRRTVNKSIPAENQSGAEETYTCPSCGTTLFDECESCKGIRHSLLTHCQHCGMEKTITLMQNRI